jgi:hypothetical protein
MEKVATYEMVHLNHFVAKDIERGADPDREAAPDRGAD